MLSDLKSLGIFFKYSPKRLRCLDAFLEIINDERRENEDCIPKKKLKLLCGTRWVERHTALTDFVELYDAVVYCLQDICDDVAHPEDAAGKFDSKAHSQKCDDTYTTSFGHFLLFLRGSFCMRRPIFLL